MVFCEPGVEGVQYQNKHAHLPHIYAASDYHAHSLTHVILSTSHWRCVCCLVHRQVLRWDVSSGDLGQCLQRLPLLTPDAAAAVAHAQASPALIGAGSVAAKLPPAIHALDAMKGSSGTFVAGNRVLHMPAN